MARSMAMKIGFRMHVIAFAACLCLGGCESGTEGRAVRFDLAIGSVAEEGEPGPGVFETETGWRIVLDEARVALGPVYLYAASDSLAERLAQIFVLLPVARAHGGTDPYAGRVVRGELLDSFVLDALDPERRVWTGLPGSAGGVESLRVDLPGPEAESAGSLRGYHAWVRGTATRGDERVPFAGGLTIPSDGLSEQVEGIALDGLLDDGATVTLAVRPHAWFDGAHFERLPPPGGDGVRPIVADSQVRNAWYLGARSLAGYVATITP
jgi:hypothetical protein